MTAEKNPTRRAAILSTAGFGVAALAGRVQAQAVHLPAKVKLFDTHAHLVSADTVRYVPRPIGGELRGGAIGSPVTPEDLMAQGKEIGVARIVAVQLAHTYGYDNATADGGTKKYHDSFAADFAAKYPDVFTYTVSLNAQMPNASETIRYWVRERGAAGIRMSAISPATEATAWFASAEAESAWRTAAELGVPVCIHVFGPRRKEVLAALKPLAEKYASIPILLDHIGNATITEGAPEYGIDNAFLAYIPVKNVHIKFTTINLAHMEEEHRFVQPVFRRLVDVFGPQRLMWGSDVGNTKVPYADMVRLAREAVAGLTDAQQKQLLFSNADAIYGGKWRKRAG